jgi:YidC/Oxa1 family membrane protein insertase
MDITTLWNFLLVHPLVSLLVAAYDLVHDFGLAVVAVTVLIRLLLYPLFVIQIKNQRAMQELAPAVSELKAKYGNDKQRMSQEQMKLYQERGYNPAMGCLPLLLQMPLLLAMYSAFQYFVNTPPPDGAKLGGDIWPFLHNPIGPGQTLDLSVRWLPWLKDLGHPDPLYILPVLAGVTQLISSIMFQPTVQPKNIDPQQKMMQTMQYYFPLITVFIAQSLPAGLALYWVTTTVFGIIQQYFVSGWGQLPRFLPFLKAFPSPADRTLAARQQAALEEERRDMASKPAILADGPDGVGGPGAQRSREARRQKKRK